MATRNKRSSPGVPSSVGDVSEELSLTITAQTAAQFIPYLHKNLLRAANLVDSSLGELSLVLVNDATMTSLHHEFMNINTPTDVLTFPLETNAKGQVTSGEVIICVPEARRRSKLEKTELKNELLLYAIHGMLHLAGFDDRTARDYKKMHAKEDQILTALGVGAIFTPVKSTKR